MSKYTIELRELFTPIKFNASIERGVFTLFPFAEKSQFVKSIFSDDIYIFFL